MFPLQEGPGILLQFGDFDVFSPVKRIQVADVVLLRLQLDRQPLPWHEGPHILCELNVPVLWSQSLY